MPPQWAPAGPSLPLSLGSLMGKDMGKTDDWSSAFSEQLSRLVAARVVFKKWYVCSFTGARFITATLWKQPGERDEGRTRKLTRLRRRTRELSGRSLGTATKKQGAGTFHLHPLYLLHVEPRQHSTCSESKQTTFESRAPFLPVSAVPQKLTQPSLSWRTFSMKTASFKM